MRLGPIACVAGVLVGAAPVMAAPHRVLVLPVDGTADAATRGKLTVRIAKLARSLEGQVATAEATFADTALAVGCDPQAPACSEQVMATLGVDELVWGTAAKDGTLVVRHASKGAPLREASTTIASGEPADRIDPAMATLFAPAPSAEPPPARPAPARPHAERSETPPPATAPPAREPAPGPAGDLRDRNLGIGLVAGGGAAVVLGLALLSSYGSLQDAIDDHDTRTRDDFDELTALESRAQSRAIAGDLLLVAGLAAGGVGAYYLHRHHKRQRVAVAPALIGRGLGLTLTIVGAP